MADPISSISPAAPAPAQAAAAAPAVAAAGSAAEAQASAQAPDLHGLAAALNQHAQDLQTSLHFQVDGVTGQLVISVIDTRDNQVLMQVPSEEALAVAQSIERLHPQLMRKSA
jgi:flagellar protein FlaG